MYLSLFLIYFIGVAIWLFVWEKAGGCELMKTQKLFYAPFFLVIFILAVQPFITLIYSIEISNVREELVLVKIVESNTLQLIQSDVGVLVVTPIIMSLVEKKIPKNFIIFQALTIVFIVGGVLPIYWAPASDGQFLYYLRHIKTVPYTIGIGCLITGVIILLKYLATSGSFDKD